MAYEILFHYHPRQEDGKYNTEETETFAKVIGKRKTEEVPLEKVAAAIMGEMTRRDILIVNVEVFEFARREIAFKETKGGCIIKNRKFQYDQLQGEFTSQEVLEPAVSVSNGMMPSLPSNVPIQFSDRRVATSNGPTIAAGPLRHEVFRPNREDLGVLGRQGVRLTLNKPYPVFKEVVRSAMEPIFYQVSDDQGAKIEVSSLFFEPMRRGLVGIGLNDPQLPVSEGRLSYVDTAPIGGGSGGIDSIIAAQDAALIRNRRM
jgi:hypothetical protein